VLRYGATSCPDNGLCSWVAEVVDKFLATPPKPQLFTPPVTPYSSRPSSPSPFSRIAPHVPKFHLLLPLRPTFLKESQATHKAFNSTYRPPDRNADVQGSDRSGSNTPVGYAATRLAVKKCETLQGLAHSGQGCRLYQQLVIQRAANRTSE
jgi:hypothetical protein